MHPNLKKIIEVANELNRTGSTGASTGERIAAGTRAGLGRPSMADFVRVRWSNPARLAPAARWFTPARSCDCGLTPGNRKPQASSVAKQTSVMWGLLSPV